MPGFSEKLNKLRNQISEELESAAGGTSRAFAGGESEKAMLEAMPDPIFRIATNGDVYIVSRGILRGGAAGTVPQRRASSASRKQRPAPRASGEDGLIGELAKELSRVGKDLVARTVAASEIQTIDLKLARDGKPLIYEIRASVYNTNEVLAAARDVTSQREQEKALKSFHQELELKNLEQSDELARLKEAYRKQVALLGEEEEILKRSFSKAERLLEDTIGAITVIAQKKDPYTAGHQQNVSHLACAIAREIGLNSEQIRVIRIASLLHDIGMLFVPAEYLAKPGKLSEAEFSMVKAHPDTDFEILKTIDFSYDIANIVHQHHERLDGTGYPKGLKGDAIHLEARIIAVADVVEAMVSKRPHRPAPGIEAAIKEIEQGKGTLYEPEAVEACVKLLSEGRFSFENKGQQGGSATSS